MATKKELEARIAALAAEVKALKARPFKLPAVFPRPPWPPPSQPYWFTCQGHGQVTSPQGPYFTINAGDITAGIGAERDAQRQRNVAVLR